MGRFFPCLLSQSAFNRRGRDLAGVLCVPVQSEDPAAFVAVTTATTVLGESFAPLQTPVRKPPLRRAA